ncbi:TadE family type IV pilus minor pilin [Streptomyces pactum]|uniref:TadE family type IV pilus minor pilin n=1 Tax=Streptomyces pactum TaxID=68249 RepID=UPI0022B3E610|nr:TadE family type IV pilus minor pilin [Streptomyces pactum]
MSGAGPPARWWPGGPRGDLRRDGGFVTAEAAVAAPVLVLFAAMLIWGVMAASDQLRCVDAARAGARAAARAESPEAVRAAVRSAAPDGAEVRIRREGELVRVRVEAATAGPGALSIRLHGEAVALAEDLTGKTGADAAVAVNPRPGVRSGAGHP